MTAISPSAFIPEIDKSALFYSYLNWLTFVIRDFIFSTDLVNPFNLNCSLIFSAFSRLVVYAINV